MQVNKRCEERVSTKFRSGQLMSVNQLIKNMQIPLRTQAPKSEHNRMVTKEREDISIDGHDLNGMESKAALAIYY